MSLPRAPACSPSCALPSAPEMTSGYPAGPPDGPEPHLVVGSVEDPALDEGILHHLLRVRRVRSGDAVSVTDGAGRWRWCRWNGEALTPTSPVRSVARPDPRITVAVAATKGAKPELVVQKLTELGVDAIWLFGADRSVARWDGKARRVERLRTVARAALGQCKGVWLPEVGSLGGVGALAAAGAVRLERGGRPPSLDDPAVVVGPEGGFSRAERESLPVAVSLGPTVLRAETAAITVGAVLASLRADLVLPAPRFPTLCEDER